MRPERILVALALLSGCPGGPPPGIPAPAPGQAVSAVHSDWEAEQIFEIASYAVDGAIQRFGLAKFVTPLSVAAAKTTLDRYLARAFPGLAAAARVPRVHARDYEPEAALILLGVVRVGLAGPELAVPPWLESFILAEAKAKTPLSGGDDLPPREAVKKYLEGVGMAPSLAPQFGSLEAYVKGPKLGTVEALPNGTHFSEAFVADVVRAAKKAFDPEAGTAGLVLQ